MSVSIMATSGGPHPPEKWADITAQHIIGIIEIAPSADPSNEIAKRELHLKLFKLLCGLHAENQRGERSALQQVGDKYLQTPLDVALSAKLASKEIVKAAHGTRFAAHFEKPETQQFIYQTVGQHFADAMHVERKWYADRNPSSEHARGYKARYG